MGRPSLRFAQTAAAAFEPLTLAELKLHLRVDDDADNALITSLGVAARNYVETRTNHILCARTFYFEANAFPTEGNEIVFPIAPVTAVASVAYVDTQQTVQTLAATYRLQSNIIPSRLRTALTENAWVLTGYADDAVRITATVGYATAAAVPPEAKQAILLLVGHWYENREAVVNGTISSDVKLTVEALLRNIWLAAIS
jgi:uncharacterized phiE125 gp8 family phage protein